MLRFTDWICSCSHGLSYVAHLEKLPTMRPTMWKIFVNLSFFAPHALYYCKLFTSLKEHSLRRSITLLETARLNSRRAFSMSICNSVKLLFSKVIQFIPKRHSMLIFLSYDLPINISTWVWLSHHFHFHSLLWNTFLLDIFGCWNHYSSTWEWKC